MGVIKRLLVVIGLLFAFSANSQVLQKPNVYGYEFRRMAIDTLFALPADTFSVPVSLRTYPFIARKGTTLYLWNTSTFAWGALSGGGSGGWGYSGTVATLTGSSTVDANRNTFKISNMGTASDFSPFAEGSSLNFGAINDWGDVIIRADSIRFPLQYNSTASDTSLVKPLVISPSGKIGRLISWSLIGGGGGSQNLQQVTDIGNTTTKSIQVGDSLRVQGGNDPFVAMKQATSNQEYRLRVGVGTGLSSQSFSLYDATAAASRMVITTAGHMVLGRESLPAAHSRLLVYGGSNGANIDALPDSTQNDESNMEVMGADYYGSSFQGYGVAMTYNGNANTGSIMNYSKKNFGQVRFTGVTNFLRVIPNASLRFATNNTERMVLDSLGNVGINVQVPSYKFQIEAATGATTTPFYVNDSEDNADYVAQFRKAGVLKTGIGTNGDITMIDMTAPSTPSSGYGVMYVNTDSLRFKNDAGTVFTLGRSSGGSTSPAGNFGNLQINRNGAFATPGSDSLDFESATGLSVKGNVNVTGLINAADGSSGNPSITFSTSDNEGFWLNGTGNIVMANQNQNIWQTNTAAMRIKNTVQVNFASGDPTSTGADIGIARDAAGVLRVTNGSTGVGDLLAKGVTWSGRVLQSQGKDVASANNLSLGTDGNTFEITGTTQVNLIANTNWQNGSEITLLLASGITVKHGQATSGSNITISLSGAADLVTAAETALTLVLSEVGGTQKWREKHRVSY